MVDDVNNNQITASTIIGQLPTGWHLFGIGDTDGNAPGKSLDRPDRPIGCSQK